MKGLHEDTTGTLWALSANDERVWIRGGQVLRPPPEVMPEPFFRDEAGHVWLRTEDESVRVGGDTVIGFEAKWLPQRHPLKIAFDLEGRSWAATGDSVYR